MTQLQQTRRGRTPARGDRASRRHLPRRLPVRAAALAGAGLLLGSSLILAPPAAGTGSSPLNSNSVTLTILSVTPSTPIRSTTKQPLVIELKLTNTTDQSIDKITINGDRGNPISTESALDAAIAHPTPPPAGFAGTFATTDDVPVTTALGPHGSSILPFRSTTNIPTDAGLCLCHNAIYPLYFTAHVTDANGTDLVIGSGQTYLPSFGLSPAPQPVQVSWVWPIMDRPHRLTGYTVFTDDALAASIEGGRLDRVLKVFEAAGKRVTMTLVIDPELIDEIAVMSAGAYQYGFDGKLATGVGTAAATRWLTRLRAALAANPKTEIDFTPPADPDIESLTRNGLAWTVGLSQAEQTRVTDALGGHQVSTHVAWPDAGTLSTDTLDTVVRQGARTVIVSDGSLRGAPRSITRNALASLQTPAGPVLAAITTSTIQRYVAPVLSVGGTGKADLPKLVSEVAIRAAQDGTKSHFVVIAAPRLIDPSDVAAKAINDTAHVFWATSLSVTAASPPTVEPAEHGQLVGPAASTLALSQRTIDAAQDITRAIPALTTMLNPADAQAMLGSLPAALQRAESTSWRSYPGAAAVYVAQLSGRIDAIEAGVHILKPSGGTYTLASSSSPLPVTIENTLNVPVFVRIRVTAASGLPGFTTSDVGRQTVAPNSKLTLHIPTHVERTGRFAVQAVLLTPSDDQLGTPVYLSVHSTALGTIGIIITVTAAAVLVLALLIRLIRRVRDPKATPGTAPPVIAP